VEIETCLEAKLPFNYIWLQGAISICSRSVHGFSSNISIAMTVSPNILSQIDLIS